MNSVNVYELIITQQYLAKIENPTDRDKAAAAKAHQHILLMVEGLTRIGPVQEPTK